MKIFWWRHFSTRQQKPRKIHCWLVLWSRNLIFWIFIHRMACMQKMPNVVLVPWVVNVLLSGYQKANTIVRQFFRINRGSIKLICRGFQWILIISIVLHEKCILCRGWKKNNHMWGGGFYFPSTLLYWLDKSSRTYLQGEANKRKSGVLPFAPPPQIRFVEFVPAKHFNVWILSIACFLSSPPLIWALCKPSPFNRCVSYRPPLLLEIIQNVSRKSDPSSEISAAWHHSEEGQYYGQIFVASKSARSPRLWRHL